MLTKLTQTVADELSRDLFQLHCLRITTSFNFKHQQAQQEQQQQQHQHQLALLGRATANATTTNATTTTTAPSAKTSTSTFVANGSCQNQLALHGQQVIQHTVSLPTLPKPQLPVNPAQQFEPFPGLTEIQEQNLTLRSSIWFHAKTWWQCG